VRLKTRSLKDYIPNVISLEKRETHVISMPKRSFPLHSKRGRKKLLRKKRITDALMHNARKTAGASLDDIELYKCRKPGSFISR